MAISRGGWVLIIVWLGIWVYLAVRAFGRSRPVASSRMPRLSQ